MIYILNIPIAEEENYEVIKIKINKAIQPTPRIDYNEILYNSERTFGIKSQCKIIADVHLCSLQNLIEITNSSCIPKYIQSKNASCEHQLSNQESDVEELDEGIILLNDFNGTITSTCENQQRTLKGTFLIKFNNCSLNVQEKLFYSKIIKDHQIIPQIFQQNLKVFSRNITSLDQIRDLHLNNTQRIEMLHNKMNFNIFNTLTICAIIAVVIILFMLKKGSTIKIKNQSDPPTIITFTENQKDNFRYKGGRM
jgi:hypothetical protein